MRLKDYKSKINKIYKDNANLFNKISQHRLSGEIIPEDMCWTISEAYWAYQTARETVEEYCGSPIIELADGTTVGDKEYQLALADNLIMYGHLNCNPDTQVPDLLKIMTDYFAAAKTIKRLPEMRLSFEGKVELYQISGIHKIRYEVLDLSKAEWGIEEEEWSTCLWSHSGPRNERSGVRKVDVLGRLLETARADKVILPDDVQRRHINRIKDNKNIAVAEVGSYCTLFSMKGDVLMNKKGTKVVYDPNDR